ncbi:endonuclease/exonuclease/phosphatase family protein [Blastococcus sp. SYSU D00820]
MSRRAPRCPDCPGWPRAVALVFGLPAGETIEAAERGEVVLGGCLVEEGPMPRWACPRCGRSFGPEPVAAKAVGTLRVATWNVERAPDPWGARGQEIARWQEQVAADVWLLTEVHRDWISPAGQVACSPPRGGAASDVRRWAAVQTALPMTQLDDGAGARPQAEESLSLARVHLPDATSLLVACSVLPWGGCARYWPGLPGNRLDDQQAFVLEHHVRRIAEAWDGAEPIVWGGDFNQELRHLDPARKALGYRLAGTHGGIDRLRAAFDRFGLRPLTEDAEHLEPEAPAIDHLAVSAPLARGAAAVHRPLSAEGSLLTDHAAYTADVAVPVTVRG